MLSIEMQARLQQERWQDMIREAEADRRRRALLGSLEEPATERPRRGWLRLAWPLFSRARVRPT
ncbi:MAG: hypothetical protein KIT87_15085 [Anaerolineae bacterium]|nr:hypothetical protein [Anaerolineae bacterium]